MLPRFSHVRRARIALGCGTDPLEVLKREPSQDWLANAHVHVSLPANGMDDADMDADQIAVRTPTYICPKHARPAPTMSEAAPELSLEEKKAAKRKEIEERLAGLKLQQEKQATQKTMYFGEHPGITCDGCGACPMVGYRYKCKQATAANTPAQHPSHRLRC